MMRARHGLVLLIMAGLCAIPALAQPANFDTSLHKTREGKEFWYSAANGGFEAFTGVTIEELECKECHGPTNADGDPYDPWIMADCIDCHPSPPNTFDVQESQCLGCHGRQKTESMGLGYSDVHRDAGMKCWDCHTSGDLHGDGTVYNSMLEPDAIDVDCEDCHDTLPAEHLDYDPHGGEVHCKSCHTQSVITCYNCHFESQVESHVKRAKQPLKDFVMLVNREEDGKVHPATFQSLSYQGSAFTAFAPYTAHTIALEGRGCPDCHNNFGGTNEAINQYNDTGLIRFAEWDDTGKVLSWIKGVVPIPEDYQETLRMDFITYDGDTSDPPGPSSNWSSIGKDTWDGSQMFFATPLTREQMAKLGFVVPMEVVFDIKPGGCPNSVGVNSRGVLPAAILGGESFDVSQVDPSSLELEGVPALRYSHEDVAAPCDGDCCMGETYDGYDDLTLKFDTPAVLAAIGASDGATEYELTLTGSMMDGTPIEGVDTIVLRGKPNWRWADSGRGAKSRTEADTQQPGAGGGPLDTSRRRR